MQQRHVTPAAVPEGFKPKRALAALHGLLGHQPQQATRLASTRFGLNASSKLNVHRP
ncbi:hypothetical protein CFter6_1256 [Collimonas fungivorans]|uniref:Uncharacterized protein n=1 Tax=Collimonas fungivorans TaxID=158899 RepID=A0A127P821_9BURK|nr:hypothetical protein CFter6_1256 [Collimonas fungivorans]